MALNLIPGVNAYTAPVSAGINVGRGVVGEKNYQKGRGALTWGMTAFMGFVPMSPVVVPFQIIMFIILSIIFIFIFEIGIGQSFILAYLAQGFIIMCTAQWIFDKVLKFGLGV